MVKVHSGTRQYQEMFTLKFTDFTVVYISQLSIRAPCILTVDCIAMCSLSRLPRLDVFICWLKKEDGMMGVTRQLTTQSQLRLWSGQHRRREEKRLGGGRRRRLPLLKIARVQPGCSMAVG